MSNNVESLYSKKIRIESMIARLNKECEQSNGLSGELKVKIGETLETLATDLRNAKNGIKVGILKKIETMDLETLYAIAFSSLSIFSEGINPDTFINEYEQLKKKHEKDLEAYKKGQQEELQKRRELVSNLKFEVEGPVYLFVDGDGNPRTKLIIEDKDLERIKKQVKENPGFKTRLFNVKVSKWHFSDEELLELGPSYETNCTFHMANTRFSGDCFNSLPEEELQEVESGRLPYPSYSIHIHNEMLRQFNHKYHPSAKPQEDKRIAAMKIIVPIIKEKQKLLCDASYLKRYVQELLVESDFLNYYLSIDANNPDYQALRQFLQSSLETFFSEEEFNSIVKSIILAKLSAKSQQIFGNSKDITIYREYIRGIKREKEKQIKQPYPRLWLKSEALTREKRDAILSRKTPFSQEFKRLDGFSGEIASPGFITEEDLNMLEQNQMITKEINGIVVSFGLDYCRTKNLTKYCEERKQNSSSFYEDLKRFIDSYRNAVNSYYPNQLQTIALCDKQLEVLKELEQKLPRPISQGSFKL